MAIYPHPGVLAAALILGLAASGCARTTEAPPAATSASPATSSASAAGPAPSGADELSALVPTPANTALTKGPDPIADNGVHRYFEVNGAPNEVMSAFKAALQGKGWELTPVSSRGGDERDGGGATFIGTLGEAYGVFEGGGYQSTTYIDVCTWPQKPANPDCQH